MQKKLMHNINIIKINQIQKLNLYIKKNKKFRKKYLNNKFSRNQVIQMKL